MSKATSIKDLIYENIYSGILAGEFPVNTILNEKALTERYAVSKTPVREALVQLCSEGILQNIPRYGYQVTPVTPKEIHEVCELRIILEMAAFEKTISNLTAEQLRQLETQVETARAQKDERDVRKQWQLNLDFHLFLCGLCGNLLLYAALEQALKFCSRGAAQFFNEKWAKDQGTDEHTELVRALKKQNYAHAKQILYHDIYAMKNQLLGIE